MNEPKTVQYVAVLPKQPANKPFDQDPFFAISVTTYLIVFGVSFLAGLVSFIRKINDSSEPLPLGKMALKFAGEQLVAIFAGLLTFWICVYVEWSMTVTVIMISLSAHMGGKAIDTMIDVRTAWIELQKSKLN
jgi:hypothetical protein